MSTENFVIALSDVRSFAKEIRTPELRKDAISAMVQAMRTGLLGRLALLEGDVLRDELARFFTFIDDEHNAFMADVLDDAIIAYTNELERLGLKKNIRQIIVGALLKSKHKNMSGVQDAITCFKGEGLGIFRRKLAA